MTAASRIWILRVRFYDADLTYLSYTDADKSTTAPSSWTEEGGDFTTPANAAYVKLQLWNYMNSGWVAYDDVSLRVVGSDVVTRKYYYAGATRIAARENDELHYLLGDHLGSTALTANADGTKQAELRYYPFGDTRYASGSTPTARRFTGQIDDGYIKLYQMGARWYDPQIGRFISADTIVPDPANPQSLNRFSYVYNNPLRFIDPTGHCPAHNLEDPCWDAYNQAQGILGTGFEFLSGWNLPQLNDLLNWLNAGVRFVPNSLYVGDAWTSANVKDVLTALDRVQTALGDKTMAALGLVSGATLTFVKLAGTAEGGSTDQPMNRINLWLTSFASEDAVEVSIHEMGHIVDWHARPVDSPWGWSCSVGEWGVATGYGVFSILNPKGQARAPTSYARTNPGEDFAETFTWYVESLNPGSGGFSDAFPSASAASLAPRLNALSVALDEFP